MVWSQLIIDWLHLLVLTMCLGALLHESGLISLGHAGVALAAAYGAGFVLMTVHSPAAVICGVLCIAGLLAAVVLRVRSDIFAVVTLAFAEIGHRVALGAVDWTGGALGLGPIPRPDWLASDTGAIVAASVVCGTGSCVYLFVFGGIVGVRLGSTRDNETVAQFQGVETRRYLFGAVFITALVAGLGGILHAMYFGLVTPRSGTLEVTLQGLAAAMLARLIWRQGSPALSLVGYCAASLLLVGLPVAMRQLLPGDVAESILRQIVFGVCLYVLVHPMTQMKHSVEAS